MVNHYLMIKSDHPQRNNLNNIDQHIYEQERANKQTNEKTCQNGSKKKSKSKSDWKTTAMMATTTTSTTKTTTTTNDNDKDHDQAE